MMLMWKCSKDWQAYQAETEEKKTLKPQRAGPTHFIIQHYNMAFGNEGVHIRFSNLMSNSQLLKKRLSEF